jgi:hypothetical protein
MLTTINPALRRRRIGLVLGAVGVTALLAAALPPPEYILLSSANLSCSSRAITAPAHWS